MKYKIKFEIDLSGLSKQEIRDHKIDMIQSDLESLEMEIDSYVGIFQMPIPKVDECIYLYGREYKVMGNKYSLDKEEYSLILVIKSKEDLKIQQDRENDLKLSALRRLIR